MLPACRTDDDTFAIPQLDVSPSEVEGFLHELQAFHTLFEDCFTRYEPREHFYRYMVEQFSALERKSIEPMALEVTGGRVRAMQRLITNTVWDEEQMRWNFHH